MISVPTTLILGAGASKPYGLPTGAELRRMICDLYRNDNVLRAFDSIGYSKDDLMEFCDLFAKSRVMSIDRFLGMREELHDIGKAAIAAALIQCEKSDTIHSAEWSSEQYADDWYSYLWNRMDQTWDGFGNNKLNIITFNYDRSLEFFLATALSKLHRRSLSGAIDKLATDLRIVHVYGIAGRLSTQDSGDERLYSCHLSETAIRAAVNGLRVIPEHRDHPEDAKKIRAFLENSQRICYLGFSYDPINVARLKLDESLPYNKLQGTPKDYKHGKDVSGTVFGLRSEEAVEAARLVKGSLDRFRDRLCGQFLREYGILLGRA